MYWVQAQKPFLKKKIRTQWYCARQSHWLTNCRIHFGCFICENANHFGKTYIFSTPIQNWVDIECIGIICYISLCQYILPTEIIMIPSEDTIGVEGNYTTLCSKFYTWYLPQRECWDFLMCFLLVLFLHHFPGTHQNTFSYLAWVGLPSHPVSAAT